MSSNDALFKMVQDISDARPLRPERVAEITGHKLHPVPQTSFFESQDDKHSWIRSIDFRGPGLVTLTIAAGHCIKKKEVMSRYGDRPEISFQTHRRPPQGPTYFAYRFPWGKVSFGFDGKGEECLQSVTVEVIGA